jgi:aspartyl-tRNA(Asn)/glutamyl-tRNA(Gln) amidotransferase subunit B
VEKNTISRAAGVTVLEEVFVSGKDPESIIKEKGLIQISDSSELDVIIDEILKKNPKSIEDYNAGKQQAIGYLVGQTMKASKGQANPKVVNDMLRLKLQK